MRVFSFKATNLEHVMLKDEKEVAYGIQSTEDYPSVSRQDEFKYLVNNLNWSPQEHSIGY